MILQSIGYRLWSSATLAITATSIAVATLLVPALLETATAEEEAHSDLAQQTQNPVSNLISVPLARAAQIHPQKPTAPVR